MKRFLGESFRQIMLTIVMFCDMTLNMCFGLTELKGGGELKNVKRYCI